ncbi:AAA domain-containing protein [Xylanibacter muris]|uniref:AAA family ATPase n=1 Tax=Xylanibacter muris TaxID=2736290 RepID=A0ABX2AMH0_9BACT|nr:AAA domain-containing protein [Xylanibacter muris]NPD92388.1 AAA family ATPase [Xylanibacter muris]
MTCRNINDVTSEYISENAEDYISELLAAVNTHDIRKTYSMFGSTLQRVINQNTRELRIKLIGPFAKIDFLLKEHKADNRLRKAVNDTRVRLRRMSVIETEMLENFLYADFESLCLFVCMIYGIPVPEEVAELFPARKPEERRTAVAKDYMRIIVNRWDGNFIYGTSDTDGAAQVTVCYTENRNYPYDWSYLGDMLYENAQLNIIRPVMKDQVLYPELIILEPDYLVDISAIATCFEDYTVSPLLHLLNKIKPSACTEPVLLGNFASQLLDEEINSAGMTYNESAGKFFRNNAIGILTAGTGREFHENARNQKRNICKAVGEDLAKSVGTYNPRNIILEPSFFSEMLGIQGRMDFLQLDFKVLVEQKSGRGAYPQPSPDSPSPQLKHYVQLLLYMTLIRYNFHVQYSRNGKSLYSFLLYSKYKNGLVGTGFAPEKVWQAIRIRNGIVYGDFRYAAGGMKILGELSADRLNTNQVHGKLWEMYVKPSVDGLLRPIHEASRLELAYYYRMMTFIANEHLLSKIGDKKRPCSGFASTWHDSIVEKLASGNIYDNLTLVSPDSMTAGSVDNVVLRFSDSADNDMANFRRGDTVILYPYDQGTEPDIRKTIVFRCSIDRISTDRIRLCLKSVQADAHIFIYLNTCGNKNRKWAIEHDFFESSVNSLYRGMHAFLSAPKERRNLILMQREPQTDKSIRLNGEYASFNTLALKAKQARDLFIIIGPPGTGKTSFGLLYALLEELTEPDSSVLLLAYTNRAVDEICGKLTEHDIDFIRIGSRLSCGEEYRGFLMEEKVKSYENIARLYEEIKSTRVFVGTTTAYNSDTSIFKIKRFTLAVIDEASQILEPHLMGILAACHGSANGNVSAIDKFILIGDYKQLPAVVRQTADESAVTESMLNDIFLYDCRLSFFERMLRKYKDNDDVTFMLTGQGRMHTEIMDFPNQEFYGGKLRAVPLPHQTEKLIPSADGDNDHMTAMLTGTRVAFIDVPAPDDSSSENVNRNEAMIIASAVVRIFRQNRDSFNPLLTVGVIVPYRNQISTVRNIIGKYNIPELEGITIDTVERYQGSQRDYIIYGFTIRKYHQLEFLTENVFEEDGKLIDRKLNVAMTRARKHLIITGNGGLLSRNHTFHRLIEYTKNKKSFFSVLPDDIPEREIRS